MTDPKRIEQLRQQMMADGLLPRPGESRSEALRRQMVVDGLLPRIKESIQETETEQQTFLQKARNFGKEVVKEVVSPVTRAGVNVYGIAKSAPSLVRAIGSRITGDIEGEREAVQKGMAELRPRNLPFVGETQPLGTPLQAVGAGVNAGLTAISFGSGTVARQLAQQALKKTGQTLARRSVGSLAKTGALARLNDFIPVAEKILGYGKGIVPRALEQGVLGTGLTAGSVAMQDRLPTKGELATGFAVGSAFPIAGTGIVKAKEAIGGLSSKTARGLMSDFISPRLRDLSYGKDPVKGILDEKITFKSFEEGAQKTRAIWQQLGKDIGAKINAGSNRIVNFTKGIEPLDKAMAKVSRLNSLKGMLPRLQAARDDVLGIVRDKEGNIISQTRDLSKISQKELFKLKEDVADITIFTGNYSDDEIVNKALKQVYGKAKDELNKWNKGLAGLNERYANLRSADTLMTYRDKIPVTFRSQVKTTTRRSTEVLGIMAGISSGNPIPALAAATVLGADILLDNPRFRTTLAKWLYRATSQEKQSALRQVPGLVNLIERVFGEKAPGTPYAEPLPVGLGI